MYKQLLLCLITLISIFLLVSCFKLKYWGSDRVPNQKVWGSKPIYSKDPTIKQVKYTNSKQPVISAGNICVFGNYIYQVDVGTGIHIIDNTIPANADRVGFINVLGCSQISIKGHYLYTNFLNDLVTLDISNTHNVKEISRVKDAFPEILYNYAQPKESGYYECPNTDSVVIGWKKDSLYFDCCYKP